MAQTLADQFDGFLFDLDGTLYLGDELLPGVADTLATLRRQGKQVLFVSNKPLEPKAAYAEKLTRLGVPATARDVLTSAYVLGRYLAQHEPHRRYYLIGEENLRQELAGHGLTLVAELEEQDPRQVIRPDGIDGVIVAFDRTLDYRKLNTAYQALRRGARYFATNGDRTCPLPGGDVPDAGATIAALHHLTGRWPELIAGKPSALMAQVALERLGLSPARCLMVGDRMETDIRMGHQAGMKTAVVLTGVTRREDLPHAEPAPDYVLERLDVLLHPA